MALKREHQSNSSQTIHHQDFLLIGLEWSLRVCSASKFTDDSHSCWSVGITLINHGCPCSVKALVEAIKNQRTTCWQNSCHTMMTKPSLNCRIHVGSSPVSGVLEPWFSVVDPSSTCYSVRYLHSKLCTSKYLASLFCYSRGSYNTNCTRWHQQNLCL